MRARPIAVSTEASSIRRTERNRFESRHERHDGIFSVDDEVWVRRRGSRCWARSQLGRVTAIISSLSIEVDGVPHHVRNLRRCKPRSIAARPSTRRKESIKTTGSDVTDDWPLLVHIPATAAPQEANMQPAALASPQQMVATSSTSHQLPEESLQEPVSQLRSGLRWRD